MRLIDADALKEKLFIADDNCNPVVTATEIDNAPTVEAKEVVHGKWVDGCCSNCGAYIPTDSLWDDISERQCNFCHECGADMRTSAE